MNRPLSLKRDETELERLEHFGVFELKADDNGAQGVIEGYGSIFGEVDQGSDVVMRGAFKKSLAERSVRRIPMYFGHAHSSVPIGVWTELKEDGKGLKVRGQLDLQSNDGGQAYRVLKMGAEIGISIGYRTIRKKYLAPDGKEVDDWCSGAVRRLYEVDLRELSLTAMPMCDGARVTGVKQEGGPADSIRAFDALAQCLNTKAAFAALARALEPR